MKCDTLQRNMDAVNMRNDDLKIEMKDIGTPQDDLQGETVSFLMVRKKSMTKLYVMLF